MNRSATRSLARTRNSIGLTLTLAALALCAVVSSAAAEDGCALELSAEASSAIVGGQQSLAATVAAACGLSDPEGTPVTFTVTSGPHAGVTGVTTLDAFGTARFSYQGARGGVDLVSATLECTGSPCPAAATASVTWSEPDATPVVSLKSRGVASVSVSRFKRCVRGRFAIRPRYGDAAIQSSTLFVDGRRIKTNTGLGRFVLGARRFKAGKHHFEIVTIFEGGAAASKFGSFSRCKSR